MIRFIFLLCFFIFITSFVINNTEEMVVLNYFFGIEIRPIPLYLLVVGSFLTGILISLIMITPGWIRSKIDRRRQKRFIEEMKEELSTLRRTVSQEKDRNNAGRDSFDEAI
ncbi:MAG: lipopolysaccharide assembly protein LapA domain-containing protein [Nitrospirota bacterium]